LNKSLTVAAVGDISFNGGYNDLLSSGAHVRVFDGIKAALAADLLIGNLEAVLITDRPADPPWRFCMRGAPEYAKVLQAAGFHVLTMASNHTMDYGWDGVEETLRSLHALGILTAGAGLNEAEARKPASLNVNGLRVAVLAYCSIHVAVPLYATATQPGIAYAEPAKVIEDIRAARRDHDVVLVSIHWGDEYVSYPKPAQRQVGYALIQAGANWVFGHHPHVLQGYERIGDGGVAYSLGNFVFSEEAWRGVNKNGEPFTWQLRFGPQSRQTAVLRTQVAGNGNAADRSTVDWTSVWIEDDLSLKLTGDARPLIDRLSRPLSAGLGYRLYWLFRFLQARLQQRYRANFRGRKLSKIRGRHLKGLWRMLVHEFEQLRGAKG
jgi:hypothetical protein